MNERLALANACLSLATIALLCAGYRAIRRGDVVQHRRRMLAALATSGVFLVSFVGRFVRYGFTEYQGEGVSRGIYLGVLFSHEPLAVINVPLAVVTSILGLRGSFAAHKEVARRALPVWLYVATTGVLLYVLLYQ